MNVLKNRKASFLILTAVYIFAAAAGILVYIYLPLSQSWLKLLIADVVATVVTFSFSLIFENASVYDPYWSVQPIVILIAFAIKAKELGWAQILMLIAVCVWGVRLTANWAYTFHGLNHQDWRYTMLKEKTGKLYPLVNFLGIHLVPTLIVYGCTLPAVFLMETLPAMNTASTVFFQIFTVMSLGAATLQGVADIQMHAFRKRKSGGFIREGVWKHSRHPNYLGEILMWWGVALACFFAMPQYWYLSAGALMNNLLFLFVSIPMADKRQSRKEGFDKYKKETRMLLPFPKSAEKIDDSRALFDDYRAS